MAKKKKINFKKVVSESIGRRAAASVGGALGVGVEFGINKVAPEKLKTKGAYPYIVDGTKAVIGALIPEIKNNNPYLSSLGDGMIGEATGSMLRTMVPDMARTSPAVTGMGDAANLEEEYLINEDYLQEDGGALSGTEDNSVLHGIDDPNIL